MNLKDRSYNTNIFRPRPKVEQSDEFIILVTSWAAEDKTLEVIRLLEQSLKDQPVSDETVLTVPVEKTTIEKMCDGIRNVNTKLYQEFNKDEFKYCYEVMLIKIETNRFFWANVGSPFLFLYSTSQFLPLSVGPDWGWRDGKVTPVPRSCIGISDRVDVQFGQFEIQNNDQFCLLNRSYAPAQFYQMPFDLDQITAGLIKENDQLPFWVGLLNPYA